MYTQQAADSHTHQANYAGCGGRGRHWGRHFGHPGHRGGPPWARFFEGIGQPVPVNIETTETSFVLTLFAAGLVKENISLTVQHDVLTIAYRGSDPAPAGTTPDSHYTRREFRNPSFERAFQLNGQVLTDNITASYAEGILTVTLPKNPATNQPPQPISVS